MRLWRHMHKVYWGAGGWGLSRTRIRMSWQGKNRKVLISQLERADKERYFFKEYKNPHFQPEQADNLYFKKNWKKKENRKKNRQFVKCIQRMKASYDDINRTPGYQVKIRHFVQLFILFFGGGLYLGLKSAKYLCRMHNKMFKSSYTV